MHTKYHDYHATKCKIRNAGNNYLISKPLNMIEMYNDNELYNKSRQE